MYGSISKKYLTHSVIESIKNITELYVDSDFDWMDKEVKFYIKHSSQVQTMPLLSRMQKIWGDANCRLYFTTEFDSILLTNKKLIYSNGRWYD